MSKEAYLIISEEIEGEEEELIPGIWPYEAQVEVADLSISLYSHLSSLDSEFGTEMHPLIVKVLEKTTTCKTVAESDFAFSFPKALQKTIDNDNTGIIQSLLKCTALVKGIMIFPYQLPVIYKIEGINNVSIANDDGTIAM